MYKAILLKITICALALSMGAKGQVKTNKVVENNVNTAVYKRMLNNALSLEDNASALQACHLILAQEGSNSAYKDTLALLYYSLGSYKQTLLVTNGLLKQKPDNVTLLAITAGSYSKLGGVKEAISYQEKLYQLQPTAVNGFGLVEMQMSLQRFAEGLSTADRILSSKIDSNLVYSYKDSTGKNLQTPLKAAIYTYMGSAYFKQSNKVKAKEMFSKALQIDDKFLIARSNFEAIKED